MSVEKRLRKLYDAETTRRFRIMFDDQTAWSELPIERRIETAIVWHREALADARWELSGRGRRQQVGVSASFEHELVRDLFRRLRLGEVTFEFADG